MSHIVTIKTQVRNALAVNAACQRLGICLPVQETVQLFSTTATGLAVRLPQWTYPVVCNLATGEVHFDNYAGQWGEQRCLDQFLQAYAVEMSKLQARKLGHTVVEQPLPNGSIKLVISVGGAA